MYAPTLGRFLQPDPIGYKDGLNAYAYAHADPVNGTDPSGMDAIEGIVVTAKLLHSAPNPIVQAAAIVLDIIGFLFDIFGGGSAAAQPPSNQSAQNDKTQKQNQQQSTTCAGALRTAGQTSAAIARANSSMSILSQAASATGIDPALLAAIGVRETGFQSVAQAGGGGGMGAFQLTNQQGVTPAQAYNIAFAANYAAGMLSSNMSYLYNKFPSFTPSQLLQATAASYNFGTGNIRGNPSTIDVGTSPKGAGNYGSNVVNLTSCFSH